MTTQQEAKPFVFKETPLYNRSNTVWGKPWNAENRASPNVMVDMYNNNPRLRFRLNHPDEIGTPLEKLPAYAKFDINYFRVFRTLAEAIIAKREENSFSIANMKYNKGAGKTVDTVLSFGRNAALDVYIEIKATGRPDLRIVWEESFYHAILDAQQNPINKGLISGHIAKAWLDTTFNIVDQLLVTEYVDSNVIKERIESWKKTIAANDENTSPAITSTTSTSF